MPIDFSSYNDDLIRAGTVATVQMHIVYGDGTDNVLTYTKDRSGKLDQLEPPDLGKLLAKITSSPSAT